MKKIKFIRFLDKSMEWTVYLTLFAVPFSKSIIEVCISAGIVLLVTKKILIKDYKLLKTPANIPLLFVFLTAALSLFNSEFMDLSIRALFSKNLKFIALYFLVVETINDKIKVMNLLKIGLISAIIVFADVFIQHFITRIDVFRGYPAFKYYFRFDPSANNFGYNFMGYPTGPFPFPNDLSAWLLIVMPTMLVMSLFDLKNRISRYSLSALSISGIYILVLAKVRGAWLAFILSVVSSIFLMRKKLIAVLILAGMFVLILCSFLNSPSLVFGLSSVADRGGMWANGVKIFKEHPIIGNGINTFFNKYRYTRQDADRGRGSYAHNCYLQMAADVGILGLAAFLWFILSIFRTAITFIKSTQDEFYYALILGLTLGTAAFLLHSAVDTNLYSLNLASFFWISAGFLIAAIKTARANQA